MQMSIIILLLRNIGPETIVILHRINTKHEHNLNWKFNYADEFMIH